MLVPEATRLNSQQVLDYPWIKKVADQAPTAPLPPLVLKNLKVFRGAEKVKKAVLTYLATQLSEKEIEPLKTLFLSLDKNGDGRLSVDEIRTGFAGRPDQAEFLDIMQSMDTDKSGFIDYNGTSSRHTVEFLAAALGEEIYLSRDKLVQAFNMFDKVTAFLSSRTKAGRSMPTSSRLSSALTSTTSTRPYGLN